MTDMFRRYYGSVGATYGAFTISIDGSTPERLSASNSSYLDQRMLWSNTSLGTGRHNVTLTHDDSNIATLSLDFFRSVNGVRRRRPTSDSTYPPMLSFIIVQYPPRGRLVYAPSVYASVAAVRLTDCG